jgi:hypothetical protein
MGKDTKSWKNPYNQRWYYRHRDSVLSHQRKWRKEHPDNVKNVRLKNSFGITLDDYNKMFQNQRGCCLICGKHQSNLVRRLSVDHNHKTERIRGLLCSKCNCILGNCDEKIDILQSAVDYLRDFDE